MVKNHSMRSAKLSKTIYFVIGVGTLILLLYYTQKHIDFATVFVEMRRVSWGTQAGLVAAFLASRYFQAQRFRAIHGAGLGKRRHFGISLAGQFINAVIPMRGGELVRPYYLIKTGSGTSLEKVVFATVFDKFAEAITLLPIIVIGYFFYRAEIGTLLSSLLPRQGALTLIFSSLAILLLLAAGFKYLQKKKGEQLKVFLKMDGALAAIANGLGHWVFFVIAFAILIGDLKAAIFVAIVVNFAAAVPVSPGSLGVFEAAYVWAAAQVQPGLSSETLLANAVVLHFVYLMIPVLGGTLFFLRYGIPKPGSELNDLKAPKV